MLPQLQYVLLDIQIQPQPLLVMQQLIKQLELQEHLPMIVNIVLLILSFQVN
jgi:hypothetical protein